MATRKKADGALDEKLLKPDQDAPGAPRIAAMSQVGYTGLKVTSKQILEEADRNWRMPQRIKTADEMCKDASIAGALFVYTAMLSRVPYKIVPPVGATPEEKERAKFVESCLKDMDTPWFEVMSSVLTSLKYGFSILEKQYKRRTKDKSAYNDGLIGVKGLFPRSQATISGWIYSEDGRTLEGVEQSLSNLEYPSRLNSVIGSTVEIPADKLMIFSTNKINNNVEGSPILKNAYTAWRMKRMIEDEEVKGVARDLNGLFKITMPAAYMDPNADSGKKNVFEEFKRVVRNISVGEQSGLILPSDVDPDSKKELFTAALLSSAGAKAFDTTEIISRWDNRIMISLFADVLNVGNDGNGSGSLVEGKTELIEVGIEYRLKEIASVVQAQLIKQLYQMNGWNTGRICEFQFDTVSKPTLDSISKAVQRILAVSGVERDRAFLNMTREAFGLEPFPDDEPVHEDELGETTSRSGDGMTEGMSNGTGKSNGKSGDSSAGNKENAE